MVVLLLLLKDKEVVAGNQRRFVGRE